MYHSLEARSPLLDQSVWEFASTLPPAVRFHGGRLKAVLREIVRRHIGPDVAYRRKQGFTIPVESWLASHWKDRLTELRQDSSLLTMEGWLDRKALSLAIDRALAERRIPIQMWHIVVFEHWLRRTRSFDTSAALARTTIRK